MLNYLDTPKMPTCVTSKKKSNLELSGVNKKKMKKMKIITLTQKPTKQNVAISVH
jgi:hypothetical protein